jgi:hypothetical protein
LLRGAERSRKGFHGGRDERREQNIEGLQHESNLVVIYDNTLVLGRSPSTLAACLTT